MLPVNSPKPGSEGENLVLELGSGIRKTQVSTVATPTGTPPGLDLQTGYILSYSLTTTEEILGNGLNILVAADFIFANFLSKCQNL